jgi:hypothetical protein
MHLWSILYCIEGGNCRSTLEKLITIELGEVLSHLGITQDFTESGKLNIGQKKYLSMKEYDAAPEGYEKECGHEVNSCLYTIHPANRTYP